MKSNFKKSDQNVYTNAKSNSNTIKNNFISRPESLYSDNLNGKNPKNNLNFN